MNTSRWAALGSSALLVLVSELAAFVWVARNDWLDAGDLDTFALWSILGAAPAYPVLRRMQRIAVHAGGAVLLFIAALEGVLYGFAWSFLVTLVLSDDIAGFGFPVLLCWVTGSVAAFLSSAVMVRPRIWPGAAGLILAIPVALGALLAWRSAAPPDAIVRLRQGTTQDQIMSVWTDGLEPLEGVRSISAWDTATRPGLRISFQPRTSKGHRDEILSRARSLPFVEEIVDVTPADDRAFEETLRDPLGTKQPR
jgi:hypothetical protein